MLSNEWIRGTFCHVVGVNTPLSVYFVQGKSHKEKSGGKDYLLNIFHLLSRFAFLLASIRFLLAFSRIQLLHACLRFSQFVHHSRFSARLSVLIPFLWLTWGLFSGFGIKAWATNLWTLKFFLQIITTWYFWTLKNFFLIITFHVPRTFIFLTFHKLETWYTQSNNHVFLQISCSI